jgi:hypothetical protein
VNRREERGKAGIRPPDSTLPWPHPTSGLEQWAARMGIDDEELRQFLHDEIQRRLRAHSDKWKKLDATIEERERRSSGAA